MKFPVNSFTIISIISFEPYGELKYLTYRSIDDAINDIPNLGAHLLVLKNSPDIRCKELGAIIEKNYNTFSFNANVYKKSKAWPTQKAEIEAYDFFTNLKKEVAKGDDAYKTLTSKYLKDFYIA